MNSFLSLIKKNKQNIYLISFFLFILIFHFFYPKLYHDDFFFQKALKEMSLFDFLKERYQIWSSRLLIEAILSYFVNHFLLWKILDSLIFTYIAYAIITISIPPKYTFFSFLSIIYLMLIPLDFISGAGWVTTTEGCVWPVAAFFPTLIVFKKIFNNKKIKIAEYGISIFLLFFAVNHEQIAALSLGLTIVFYIIFLKQNRTDKSKALFFIIQLLITVCSLIFIFTTPGNENRTLISIKEFFPNWADFSLLQKCEMGFLSIFSYFWGIRNINFLIVPLLLVLVYLSFKNKNKLSIIAATALLFLVLIFGYGFKLISIIAHRMKINLPIVELFQNQFISAQSDFSKVYIALEIVIFLFITIILLLNIFYLSKDKNSGLLNLLILSAGFCSAFILSFSPTVYASGTRTLLYFALSIIIVTCRLLFIRKEDILN